MKLIAVKDISHQLPAGAAFERANRSDGEILVALGVAREVPESAEPDPLESSGPTSQADPVQTPHTPTRRGRYRTRVLRAETA